MARKSKASEDTESILARLRRESLSGYDAPKDMLQSADIGDAKSAYETTADVSDANDTETAKEQDPASALGEDRPRQSAAELLQELLADEERRGEIAASLEEKKEPPAQGGFLQRLFENWLSPEGRMGQKLFVFHFIGSMMSAAGLTALIMGAAAAVLSWLGAGRPMPSESLSLAAGFAALLCVSVPLALLLIVFLRSAMRRWHDLGYGDTTWLIAVICPLAVLALAAEARSLLLYLNLPPLLGVTTEHFLLRSFLPYGCTAGALLVLLHIFLLFAEGELSSNASGSPESAERLRPQIAERPTENYPFFLRMIQFKGRMNRKRFLLRLLFLLFFVCLLLFVILETAERLPPPLSDAVALYGTAAACALASILPTGIVFQRLHDIGRSGWLAGLPLILTLAFIACLAFFGGDLRVLAHEPFGIEIIAAAFLLEVYEVFLFAALVFIKGSVLSNDYGEAPLQRQ